MKEKIIKEESMPKIVSVLKNYSKEQFVKDVIAGIIVAIIALPLSIALALASGVGPEQGIYTAIVAGFVIALLGGSRVQISGPTAAFATIVAGIVASKGMEGLVAATILAGSILILMGLLKFGTLIKFIPYTIVTGFTSGIPATGAIARTAANVKNGGRSPISGMVHAIVLLLILIVLMPYAALIPMPAIAAILFMVAYNMCGWREFLSLVKGAPKSDVFVLLVTFVLTVVFDLVVAIEVGFAIALLLFLKRMADVVEIRDWKYVEEEEEGLKVVPKGTLVYEIAGPMFFAVADKFLQVSEDKDTKVMIIRMKGVPAMDATALRSLEEVLDDCRHKGITLLLSHVRDQPMHVMEKAGFVEKLGKENFCENIDAALERAKEIC